MGGGRSEGRFSLHPENPPLESRMHANVPVRFGRGRLDSLGNKGLAAYLIAGHFGLRAHVEATGARNAVAYRSRMPDLFIRATELIENRLTTEPRVRCRLLRAAGCWHWSPRLAALA